MAVINSLVEGNMDEAAAIRIIEAAGHTHGTCFGKKGCGYIEKKIQQFNLTAHHIHYLALVDFMDTKLDCPAEVISNWLPYQHSKMVFRVVVRELESWLLADRSNLAKFLKINIAMLPLDPEQISDPKLSLVNLARKSKSARIRDALVPSTGSTAQEGKLYASEMKTFITEIWDIESARKTAQSLDKALISLERLS
jgi:hypothetical protein